MESDKNERKIHVVDFSKYPKLAIELLESEKKAREIIRKRAELGIKTKIPKDIDEAIREAEVA